MTERRTYEAVLIERGEAVRPAYSCACCGQTGPAFSMAEALPEDGLSHPFACAECILSALRDRDQLAAADAAQAAGIDWSPIRAQREALLTRCDWTQVPDAPLSAEVREAWRAYRQHLRDLSDQFAALSDPGGVVWPTPPA